MSMVEKWRWAVAAVLAACSPIAAEADDPLGYHVIPGSFAPGRGPDGNSVFLDAPEGLILVDTGRHPAHQEKLLGFAKAKGRPIVAIVNTLWHLDHNGGNAEIRAAYPNAKLYASAAVEGALKDFFPKSRAAAEAYLESGQASAEREVEIRRDFAAMDDPHSLRATDVVSRSGTMTIAGRRLAVNLAPYAATESDIWIFDEASGLAVVGDLVVGLVPFMDTACPEGWRDALDAIAATPFTILVPGHGDVMDRSDFLAWRAAYNHFLDCAESDRSRAECVAGWQRDAARFIPTNDQARVAEMGGYYLDTRLRSAPEERRRFCPPA